MNYPRLALTAFLAFNCAACSMTIKDRDLNLPPAPPSTPSVDVSLPTSKPQPPAVLSSAEIEHRRESEQMIEIGRAAAQTFTEVETYQYAEDPENARTAYIVHAAMGIEIMSMGYAQIEEKPTPEDRALFVSVQRELQSIEHRLYQEVTKTNPDEAAIQMFGSCSQAVVMDRALKELEKQGMHVDLDIEYPAAVRARCNDAVRAVVGNDYMDLIESIAVSDAQEQGISLPQISPQDRSIAIAKSRRDASFQY